MVALAWIFGKRINEILRVKHGDVWVSDGFLHVRFHVSKRARSQTDPIPRPFLKRIRLEHPYVKYVLDITKKGETGYIFKGYGKSGHITRRRLHQQLKQIAPDVWFHLFRHSLATYMAEHGATESELQSWLDN